MTRTATIDDDLYARLGVAPSATSDEIGAAFRAQAKQLHPDLHPGGGVVVERFMKALTHAYNVLGDPDQRARYDTRRVRPAPSRTPAPPARHEPVFRTPRSARAAVWAGVALFALGIAGAAVLASVPTGDAPKTITLWIVVAKLLICGTILSGAGAWRLARLRAPWAGVATRQ